MKKSLIGCLVPAVFCVCSMALAEKTTPPTPAPAAHAATSAPAFTISRIAIAGSVEGSSSAIIATSFPKRQEKVFCYVELKDVTRDTTITFVWTYDQKEMRNVTQHVKKSKRWRTWSGKSPEGQRGEWKVEVQDELGKVLKSATFTIG